MTSLAGKRRSRIEAPCQTEDSPPDDAAASSLTEGAEEMSNEQQSAAEAFGDAHDWAFTGDEKRAAYKAITDEQFAAFSQYSFVAIDVDNPNIFAGDDDGFQVTEVAEKESIKRFFVVRNPFYKNQNGPDGPEQNAA